MAAAGSVFANPGGYDSNRTLLLATWNGDAEAASKLVSGVGRLAGRDKSSGMYIVELKNGVSPATAQKALKAKKSARYVFQAKAAVLDKSNIHSVEDHIEFLKARHELLSKDHDKDKHEVKAGPDEDEGAGTDFLEAYRYFLDGRTDANGNFNSKAYLNAVKQRAAMKPTVLHTRRVGKATGNWEFLGPKNMTPPYQQYFGTKNINGRVSGVAYTNVANKMYLSAADGGVWKSLDGGTTFTSLSDTWDYLWTSSIAVDPTDSNTVYVGTGDYDGFFPVTNFGIMKTTDGGATWTNLAKNTFGDCAIKGLLIDPDNHNHILVAAGNSAAFSGKAGGDIWQSTDGGNTWVEANVGSYSWSGLESSAPDVSGNRTFWAVGGKVNGGFIFKSTDGGTNWTQVTSPTTTLEYSLAIAPSKTTRDTVYLLTPGAHKVWKTTNGGTNWTEITNNLPQSLNSGDNYNWSQYYYDYVIGTTALPSGQDGVYVGLITGAFSNNGGTTWYDINASYDPNNAVIHSDQHVFAVDPANPLKFVTASDGGAFKHTWDDTNHVDSSSTMNNTLGITQFYAVQPHPTDATKLMGGAQDNSTPASLGDFNNWQAIYAGDGGWSAYDITHNRKYTTSQNLSIWRYNGDNLSAYISPSWSSTPGFIAPIVMSNDDSLLFAGTKHLNKYDGTTWTQNLGGQQLTSSYVRCLAVCSTDFNRIYAGSNGGNVWYTPDLGATWKLTNGSSLVASGAVSCIAPSVANANDVVITKMGFGVGHVYRCTDTSAASPTWVNISGSGVTGLPDVPANTVARDPYHPDTIFYVGNDVGVYRTEDGGATWTQMTNSLGLPNVQVNDLKINSITGYLTAGTFGRGVWRIKVVDMDFTLGLNDTTLAGGNPTTATLTFSESAKAGTSFTVSSNNSNIIVPSGSTSVTTGDPSATFNVSTLGVDSNQSGTITVTWNGTQQSVTLNLTKAKASTVLLPNNHVVGGGGSISASVVLDGKAGPSGVDVTMSSSKTFATVPGTVTVPSGTNYKSFTITTSGVDSPDVASIGASANGGTASANLSVDSAVVSAFRLTPTNVIGGNSSTGVVTLNGQAGPSGTSVNVVSTLPSAQVPASVTVPAGKNYVSFKFMTGAVSTTETPSITAGTAPNTASASLTINAATLTRLDLKPSPVVGGNTVSGIAVLNGKAGTGGASGTVTSHNTAVANNTSSPTIAAGSNYGTFKISTNPVATSTSVQFDVTVNGVTVSSNLTVDPAAPSSLSFTANPVHGGTTVKCRLYMTGKAPAGGLDVAVVSDKPGTATCATPVHIYPGNAFSSQFTITTSPVAANTLVTFTATYNGQTATGQLTVIP